MLVADGRQWPCPTEPPHDRLWRESRLKTKPTRSGRVGGKETRSVTHTPALNYYNTWHRRWGAYAFRCL